jgi:hypothetical protein
MAYYEAMVVYAPLNGVYRLFPFVAAIHKRMSNTSRMGPIATGYTATAPTSISGLTASPYRCIPAYGGNLTLWSSLTAI